MELNIIDVSGTANTTYSKAREIKYLVIHYSSGYSSKKGAAKDLCGWFRQTKAQASADFAVDDVEICQFNKDIKNRYCWAVGGSKYNTKGGRLYGKAKNANCISIEICSTNSNKKITYPNDPAYSFSSAAVENAIKLAKYLMEKFKIDASHVIRHYDVNGKCCPGIKGWNADSDSEEAWLKFKEKISTDTNKTQDAASNQKSSAHGVPASKQAYVDAVAEIAVRLRKETDILPSVVIGQCCLETGYGLGADSTALVKVNNLLGMKADLINSTWSQYSVWPGNWIKKNTPEVYGGVPTRIDAAFRVYDNYEQCIRDYEMFLLHVKNNNGYKYRSVQGKTDPREVITIISKGGYATDPRYIESVMRIIKENDLTKYDVKTGSGNVETKNTTKQNDRAALWRVQTGAYKKKANATKNMSTVKKKIGLDCFIELSDGLWHVYCGSFNKKSNANDRAALLARAGITAIIKEVTM